MNFELLATKCVDLGCWIVMMNYVFICNCISANCGSRANELLDNVPVLASFRPVIKAFVEVLEMVS